MVGSRADLAAKSEQGAMLVAMNALVFVTTGIVERSIRVALHVCS